MFENQENKKKQKSKKNTRESQNLKMHIIQQKIMKIIKRLEFHKKIVIKY